MRIRPWALYTEKGVMLQSHSHLFGSHDHGLWFMHFSNYHWDAYCFLIYVQDCTLKPEVDVAIEFKGNPSLKVNVM